MMALHTAALLQLLGSLLTAPAASSRALPLAPITAPSWQALKRACARPGASTITLSDDFKMGAYDGPIFLNSSKEVTVEGGGATLRAAGMGYFFDVQGDGTVLQLSNITLENGFSTLVGGAIQASAGASVKIRSAVFANNRAVTSDIHAEGVRWGGAIYVAAGALAVHDSTFVNNAVSNPVSLPDKGGAIYASASSVTIDNCTFRNNTAEFGGAVYGDAATAMNIARSVFTLNRARYGGALYALQGPAAITSSSFDQNTASTSGGGLYVSGVAPFDVTNSSFSGNSAAATDGGGGAIYAYYATAQVNDTQFSNNVANGAGAAVFILGYVHITMSNSGFHTNTAQRGGALWADADAPNTALLLGCGFVGNEVEGRRGANDVARGHYNVGGYDSTVTFGCARGKQGAPVTMKLYELANPPPGSLKCTAAAVGMVPPAQIV